MKLKEYLCERFELSPDEAQALIKFKGNSRQINDRIRKFKLTNEDQTFSEQLGSALEKIPSTNETVIYRNLDFIDCQLSKAKKYFRVKNVVRFREFQSCTTLEIFTGDPEHYNCTIKILLSQNSKAKDIFSLWNKFELNDAEREVIYPLNGCFEIIDVHKKEKRLDMIVKEIYMDVNIPGVPEF